MLPHEELGLEEVQGILLLREELPEEAGAAPRRRPQHDHDLHGDALGGQESAIEKPGNSQFSVEAV